jgi:hypothetical protein
MKRSDDMSLALEILIQKLRSLNGLVEKGLGEARCLRTAFSIIQHTRQETRTSCCAIAALFEKARVTVSEEMDPNASFSTSSEAV